MRLDDRLARPSPILLDGATGTELHRRGVKTPLPLWSAQALLTAPDALRRIHADYVRAGAEMITANTFRTHRRSLAAGGLGDRARELTRLAVDLARAAARGAGGAPRFIAGSIAPLEDCYSPELVPPPARCESEHREMARHLADAGADAILVETMNTVREARAAAAAAKATGLPVLVSFVCGADGRILSGETWTDAVAAIAPLAPAAFLVNCVPARSIGAAHRELRAAVLRHDRDASFLTGAYGNIGHAEPIEGWALTDDVPPDEYARLAAGWLRDGARIVGGCCGTTPAHIEALGRVLG